MQMWYAERVVMKLGKQSAVVIFSKSGCCMCHAVKRLFSGLGVSPTVHELDLVHGGRDIQAALARLLSTTSGDHQLFPVVFIGGRLIGSVDRVLASHIDGTLVPLLKQAGALWL